MAFGLAHILFPAAFVLGADGDPIAITDKLFHLGDTEKPEWKEHTTVQPTHKSHIDLEFEAKECPRKLVTFAPSGCSLRNATYSRGDDHDFFSRNRGSTCSRGTDSTRVKRSLQSSASERIALIEQLPAAIVVTPCRTDSLSDGAAMSSAS